MAEENVLELARRIVQPGPTTFERLVEIHREAVVVAKAFLRREEGVEPKNVSTSAEQYGSLMRWDCGSCGKRYYIGFYNFCPHCGTKVRRPE